MERKRDGEEKRKIKSKDVEGGKKKKSWSVDNSISGWRDFAVQFVSVIDAR